MAEKMENIAIANTIEGGEDQISISDKMEDILKLRGLNLEQIAIVTVKVKKQVEKYNNSMKDLVGGDLNIFTDVKEGSNDENKLLTEAVKVMNDALERHTANTVASENYDFKELFMYSPKLEGVANRIMDQKQADMVMADVTGEKTKTEGIYNEYNDLNTYNSADVLNVLEKNVAPISY